MPEGLGLESRAHGQSRGSEEGDGWYRGTVKGFRYSALQQMCHRFTPLLKILVGNDFKFSSGTIQQVGVAYKVQCGQILPPLPQVLPHTLCARAVFSLSHGWALAHAAPAALSILRCGCFLWFVGFVSCPAAQLTAV